MAHTYHAQIKLEGDIEMEMSFTASKWVPAEPGEKPQVKQQASIRFVGNKVSIDELLKLLEEAGYEVV